MTGATKIKQARERAETAQPPESRLPRSLILLAVVGLVGLVAAGALLWGSSSGGSGGSEEVFTGVPTSDPGPVHVHGLGINPADRSLLIATHTGLYRAGRDERKAVRVGDLYQDTMGFSVVGPDRFIGSGHPDARDPNLPPLLGLIESDDAGRTWTPVSLLGDADFHVLRSQGRYVYGYDATNDRLLASTDEGQSWQELAKPEGAQIVDLAPDPAKPTRLVTSAGGGIAQGMYVSEDEGATWTRLNDAVGLLAWPRPGRLYVADGEGNMFASDDGGRTLKRRGWSGGQPAALLAVGADELYVALHDGTVKRSTDGGVTWEVRSKP